MRIPYVNIAQVQLEMAIELHFERREFIAAITLAGAAEEILAKMLPSTIATAQEQLIQGLTARHSLTLSSKDLRNNYLNKTRNSLKHFIPATTVDTTSVDYVVEIDPEVESLTLLARATANYVALQLPCTPLIQRVIAMVE